MNIFDTELFPYFEGDSIVGTEVKLKMTSIFFEDMPDHKGNKVTKVTVGFVGTKKRLVLNKTNAKRIALIHSNETNNWKGKQVVLITERVQAFGKTHNAIRIKINPEQSAALFETPEIDPVTDTPTVEEDIWEPTEVEFFAILLKDFSKGKFVLDMAEAKRTLQNDCGVNSLKISTETASGRTWVSDASELYNCIAAAIAKRPMPIADSIAGASDKGE